MSFFRITAFCFLLAAALTPPARAQTDANAKLAFWQAQRKGANSFAQLPRQGRYDAAGKLGLQFIRLAPNKWPSDHRDFLLGNVDEDYRGLVQADLDQLTRVLDWADHAGVKILLTTLSLPGCRWVQQNDGVRDKRLYQDFKYHKQAADFWRDLASALKDHPSVVGYNIFNEPAAARALGVKDEWTADLKTWYADHRGTPADLHLLNQRIVDAIREVDPDTPIILDAGFFAFAHALPYMKPIDDPAVLYDVHMYEPYAYTNWRTNDGRFTYPGDIPAGGQTKRWDRAAIDQYFQPVDQWLEENNLPPSRLILGEFGCDRRVPGVTAYLTDVIAEANRRGWHWAFYAFRPDGWQAMDYELGTGKASWAYWKARDAHKPLPRAPDNPLFDVIRGEFEKGS